MKKSIYIIISIIVILVITIGSILVIKNAKKEETHKKLENELTIDNSYQPNRVVEATPAEMENMKNEINSNADTNIYQVEEEPGGRKILQIKPEVQFSVDIAGIIKNGKPQEKEVEELITKSPTKNGVWISAQSRKDFANLLKQNEIENFEISEDGYLTIRGTSNELAKKLESMITSNKLYIINMTGIAYERDYISGEIVEYPFEDMDPYQIVEPYINDNTIILEITSNKNKKLTDKEILETIVQY